MKKILIIEDDEKLRRELEKFLNKNGYTAKGVENFENCIETILQEEPNLVLLDINLPIYDGEYLCKEVRKVSQVPIIMITSRDNEMDELISMNYGADDYVTKPFNTQILLARIYAILKRENIDISQNKIDCKDFILNVSKGEVERAGRKVDLTKNEFKILFYLAKKRGQIVSRDEIMDYLWDSEMFVDDNTLTVNVTRLRSKLEELNLKDLLETKRGQGYILNG